jgi:mannitol-1-/sugar-/sorbitol-6-phosphatase
MRVRPEPGWENSAGGRQNVMTTNKPLLLDLDGTLIDSKASVVNAFRWWAALRGLAADTSERIPHGMTSTDAAALLAPHLDATVEGRVLDERQAVDTRGVIAFAGACELLQRPGPTAIVTSCPLDLARARLRAAGLPEPALLVTPERYTHGKPHPQPYLTAAKILGVRPAQCIVVEDAPAGIEAARAAGMIAIAVLTTHGRAQLERADHQIPSLLDLKDLAL